MSTSAMNEKAGSRSVRAWKRPLIWLCIAMGCVAVTNIYALFGHGIRSDAMDYMFLYPLLGGVLGMLLTDVFFPVLHSPRLARNLYSAGIATLTTGGMMRGILDIAGTASVYAVVFAMVGWALVAAGLVAWCAIALFLRGEG